MGYEFVQPFADALIFLRSRRRWRCNLFPLGARPPFHAGVVFIPPAIQMLSHFGKVEKFHRAREAYHRVNGLSDNRNWVGR